MAKIMVAALASVMIICSGCGGTIVRAHGVHGGDWSGNVYRISVLQKTEIPALDVPGIMGMQGYKASGDSDFIGQLIKMGIKAALADADK